MSLRLADTDYNLQYRARYVTVNTRNSKTKHNKTKLTLVKSPFTTSGQETDRVHSNKNTAPGARTGLV